MSSLERRCDPRTALAVSALAAAAGLSGVRSAGVSVVAVLLWLGVACGDRRALARRLAPLAMAFALLLVFLPIAPGAVAATVLRGAAVAVATVAASIMVPRTATLATLQGMGTPRSMIAFLLVLGCHAETVAHRARRTWLVLLLRGGWDRPREFARSVAILLSALLGVALDRADRAAQCLALRGFEGWLPPLPQWRPRVAEAAHYALALALLLAVSWEVATWRR